MKLPGELCYEDIALLCAEERRMEALRNDMLEAERLLRDPRYYGSHTDRQLRELSREARCNRGELKELMGEPIEDCPSPRRYPPTRKEKRIEKKLIRRAERFLRQFYNDEAGEKSLPSQRLGRQEI
jgi:hypothetical protein